MKELQDEPLRTSEERAIRRRLPEDLRGSVLEMSNHQPSNSVQGECDGRFTKTIEVF
jgi:hypothetical protein